MSCREWENRIRPWLEGLAEIGRIPEAPPRDIAEHTEACGSCSRRLQAAQLLLRGEPLRRRPAPALAVRVSERLAREPERRLAIEPKFLRAALAAAAALAVVLAAGLLSLRFLGPQTDRVEVHLTIQAPQAGSVSVVGDWNGWNPDRDRLSDPDGDGIWEIRLKLRRAAELRYQFLIDGELWMADPQAPLQVDDGFGGTSSVLQI